MKRKLIAVSIVIAIAIVAQTVGTKVFTPLIVAVSQGGAAPEIRFLGSNGYYQGLKGNATPSSNCSWTLPAADGTSGQALTTTGGCATNWTTITGGGGGTVTSIGMTVPSWLSVTPSSISTSGTFAITAAGSQAANYFLASPNGSSGALSPRAIVNADLPCPGTHQNVVTSSRAIGTVYQNTTGCPMEVSACVGMGVGGYEAYTDSSSSPSTGVAYGAFGDTGGDLCLPFRVLPSNYYKVVLASGTGLGIQIWTEWY